MRYVNSIIIPFAMSVDIDLWTTVGCFPLSHPLELVVSSSIRTGNTSVLISRTISKPALFYLIIETVIGKHTGPVYIKLP